MIVERLLIYGSHRFARPFEERALCRFLSGNSSVYPKYRIPRPKGDILLAGAAERAGIPLALSTATNASLEEVAAAFKGDLWFQLYIVQRGWRERADSLPRRTQKESGPEVFPVCLNLSLGSDGIGSRAPRQSVLGP